MKLFVTCPKMFCSNLRCGSTLMSTGICNFPASSALQNKNRTYLMPQHAVQPALKSRKTYHLAVGNAAAPCLSCVWNCNQVARFLCLSVINSWLHDM